jgi:ATP-dependent Clp protease ATP-binding subunit ClpA
MSEYQEKHCISKLIGSPPGYVGFEENAGLLITQIQENPNAVLLFDEVEKSHPDVSTVLLQMMDNGFITGSNGKRADCRNIVLILTTNAGAQDAEKNNIGFGSQEKDYSDKELKKFFTPEFRNRLDAIVSFKALDETIIMRVVDKFLMQLEEQLHEKKVDATFSVALRAHLAKHGFDPLMGARPMQRIIQDTVRKALADELLFGKLAQGGHVDVDIDADGKVLLDFGTPVLPGKAAKADVAPAEEI